MSLGSWAGLLGTQAAAWAESEPPEVLPAWVVSETPWRAEAASASAPLLTLGREDWRHRPLTTLADALRFAPGLLALESFGGFEPPRLSLRGSGLQSAPSSRGLALTLDGLPLNLADGAFNSALFEPRLGESLTVQRGLEGWMAHPEVAGGALELRTPVTDTRASAGLEGGSFGALRARASQSAGIGSLQGWVAGTYSRQDGYRPQAGQDRASLLLRVSTGPSPRTESPADPAAAHPATGGLTTTATLYHANARYDVPGPLTLAAALASPHTISAEVRRDRPRRESSLTWGAISLRGAPDPTTDAPWNLGAAFGHTTDDFRQLAAAGVTRSRSHDLHLKAGYTRLLDRDATTHRLRLEASVSRGWRTVSRHVNQAGTPGARFAHDELESTTAVAAVQDTVHFGRDGSVFLGAAAVSGRRKANDGTRNHRLVSDTRVLPAVGVTWTFRPRHGLYAQASETVEPPTFDDLATVSGPASALVRRFQPLATQRIRTWEIGVRGQIGAGGPPASARVVWDIALFHAEWRDEILRLADANGVPRGAVNASPTTHEGLETVVRWTLRDAPPRIRLAGTATWTNVRFDADPVYGRNRLAGLPPHFGQAELTFDAPSGCFGAVGTRWTAGATRVDHAGRLGYGGSALAHLRIGWRTPSHWTSFVQIENLLDRRAIASTAGVLDLARNPAGTALFLPVVGRSVVVGVEWKFNHR